MDVTVVDIGTFLSRLVCGGQARLLILVARRHMWQHEAAFRHCVPTPRPFFGPDMLLRIPFVRSITASGFSVKLNDEPTDIKSLYRVTRCYASNN